MDAFKNASWPALRRSIKLEEIYLHANKTMIEARSGLRRYVTFRNSRRPHSFLGSQTPDQAYVNALAPMMVAAESRRKST
ncbi:Integrase core domain [Rhizobium lusitanum]|jgi:putative transposase|uniref:Integrase core domain n=1 Tax=Rhizobium lusitanum TaxID=293958 RepID=A0A1C3WUE0_9HYPH|nr:Integrase core domain [Rhizobium lusitanum]